MVVEGEYYDGPCKLLELPHYVLRELFSYLDATSLYQLSRTCNYLKEFIFDPVFWRCIDARDDPNDSDKIEYCTRRIHKKTTHFYIRGNLNFIDLPANFFETIKPFENLRILALENLKLKGLKVTLKDFPSGLEELSLKRTYVRNSDYFFQHSVKNMPKLRVLILDECSWVTCSFLLSVSKYEYLEIISIVKCLRVHMNMIPYLNVAKLGCKKLKIFDCRFTGIGGELLRTFYSKENLQRLYFQSFKSAEVDYNQNILDHSRNSRKIPPVDTAIAITDDHLSEYLTTAAKPKDEVEKIVDSVLYQDPYLECTCGGQGPKDDELNRNIQLPDDSIYLNSGREEPKFVCSKHMKDIVNLPKNFKDFFLSQQQQFNPVSDMHLDSDSNSDEEGESCCYFGMGTSLIVPSTHDRTPSAGEEMTLPDEGARNHSFPRLYIIDSNNINSTGSSSNTSRSQRERRNSTGNSSNRRRRKSSDDDSDSDVEHIASKKQKTDQISKEDQEELVNQLIESVDDVSSRIERIIHENGLDGMNWERSSHRESEPSTSRVQNGTSHPSSSTSNINSIDRPSCSTSRSPDRNDNLVFQSTYAKGGSTRFIHFRPILLSENNNPPNMSQQDRRVQRFSRRENVDAPNMWKVKWKIPLKRLSLRGYRRITDTTLGYLGKLDIELIDLTYTSVTKIGIEHFLVHNPACRVIHHLYCTCKPKYSLI